MSRLAPRTLCVLWVVLLLVVVVAGAAAPAAGQSTRTIAGTQLAPDDVSLRIDIREDGTAEWAVEYRVLLDDQNTTAAFESVRRDVEADGSEYSSEFRGRMESTAATAENATGREMAIRNVSVSASRQQLPQEYGVLTYRFVWVNFAVVDGDSIRAGDALRGLFLDEETSLLVTWPEGYVAEDAAPAPDDQRTRTIVWNGPLDFGPDEPSLVVAARESAGADAGVTTSGPATASGAGDDSSPGDGDGSYLWLGGAGVLVAAAVVGGGWALYRRRGERVPADAGTGVDADAGTETGAASPRGGTDGTGGAGAASAGGDSATAEAERRTTESDPDADGSAAATSSADDGTPPWEDELLSNEERVLALMEHEGGRLKQQEVAQTLDWTDAKTSQVVRRMREADELDAFRLGRENVLVLPDADAGREDE
ncbi:hypothetical protein NDI76_10455 [Halogeometricum sp. S1BR25-6]|uniref:Transmembrane glycoprotein / HTH domain protein n=1 Tax=Halogeometricum salsisoli TaxID=2950536 RepID=A0ABU2GED7_9EURY|nr:hypothetical protein [Halogeometricum sp. S1BR25-6]MDS0299163.1 hypothetical protein [Halogeometricum sp. S1BR25-6]